MHAAYRLEIDLLPMVHEMRRRGIRIDTAAAESARDLLLNKRDAALAEISSRIGGNVGVGEIARAKWLSQIFDQHGIPYPRTEKGNPSFTSGNTGWMHKHPHWLPPLIAKAKKYNNAAVKFLDTYILGYTVNGRIHADIHPHRSTEGGTCSLRFSYSDPPLQQMAARDEEIAPLIRGVFLPEEGEVWAKPDISQQEFRFIVHYAAGLKLPRAQQAVERYRADSNTDFHELVAQLTGLPRDQAKAVNFAKAFGAGVQKFATMIGKSEAEAYARYRRYGHGLPFVGLLAKRCTDLAASRGYLTLYDGARRHWDIGIPTHKAMNALIQGSAARHTKLWMRACWREGIVPLLQMHDALDCSVASPEQAERVAQLGREAVTLKVPIQVDLKFGRSWGDAKHTWAALHEAAVPPTPHVNGFRVLPETPAAIVRADPPTPSPVAQIVGKKFCCPFHDDSTPSLQFYDDHYHCFGCGAHGDMIDWLVKVEGMNIFEAEKGVATYTPAPKEDDPRNRYLPAALRYWNEAQPIIGTLAARYLIDVRRIDIAALPADIDLRFHPRCYFEGANLPCMLALLREAVTDEPTGIHRIALTPPVFAGGKVKRRLLGRQGRGVVKLWPVGSELAVGEGIETVLAAATRLSQQPAWSAISAPALEKFPVLPGVQRLVLLVDHDDAGKNAATKCTERWHCAGRQVRRLMPRVPGTDFNDLIKGDRP